MDDAEDGFALYRLEGAEFLRRFGNVMPSTNSCPKQVAFGEYGRIVVGGSDHGRAYVYEKDTGDLLETLVASPGQSLQTITVCVLFEAGIRHKLMPERLIH